MTNIRSKALEALDDLKHALYASDSKLGIDEIKELGNKIREALTAQQWQMIESAPRDQTQIIVYKYAADTFDHLYCIAYFYNGKWISADDGVEFFNPSHWITLDVLPPPPTGEKS